jgi:hypothetical protein
MEWGIIQTRDASPRLVARNAIDAARSAPHAGSDMPPRRATG